MSQHDEDSDVRKVLPGASIALVGAVLLVVMGLFEGGDGHGSLLGVMIVLAPFSLTNSCFAYLGLAFWTLIGGFIVGNPSAARRLFVGLLMFAHYFGVAWIAGRATVNDEWRYFARVFEAFPLLVGIQALVYLSAQVFVIWKVLDLHVPFRQNRVLPSSPISSDATIRPTQDDQNETP